MKSYHLKIKTDRVATFSDGVFAIIITLMILNIKVPELPSNASSKEIWDQFLIILPNIIAYSVSFFSLGIFWLNHHNFFHMIKHIDMTLLWINMFLLFWLSLIPLPTTFIAQHFDKPEATLLYSFCMLVCNVIFGFMYYYAYIKKLMLENVIKKGVLKTSKQIALSCIVWILSLFAGYYSMYIPYIMYFCIMIIFVYPDNIELTDDDN